MICNKYNNISGSKTRFVFPKSATNNIPSRNKLVSLLNSQTPPPLKNLQKGSQKLFSSHNTSSKIMKQTLDKSDTSLEIKLR